MPIGPQDTRRSDAHFSGLSTRPGSRIDEPATLASVLTSHRGSGDRGRRDRRFAQPMGLTMCTQGIGTPPLSIMIASKGSKP
jgi:hypothetical protein